MNIKSIEYDSDKAVVRVELEFPIVGPLTFKDAYDFLKKIILEIFPEDVKAKIVEMEEK